MRTRRTRGHRRRSNERSPRSPRRNVRSARVIARILIRMTRIRRTRAARTGRWALQDAKARFSEVVRKAKTEGPQRITVHGREEVVVVSVEEYRRVKGQPTGNALIALLQNSPLRDVTIERTRTRGPVRSVDDL